MISARTKAALAAAKARGVVLGGKREGAADLRPYAAQGSAASAVALAAKARARAEDLAPVIEEIRAAGTVLTRVAWAARGGGGRRRKRRRRRRRGARCGLRPRSKQPDPAQLIGRPWGLRAGGLQ
jgi:hypothetical protein